MTEKTQIDTWRGTFGNEYIERNLPTPATLHAKTRAFAEILSHIPERALQDILECGSNIGNNLRAMKLLTDARLHAIEPNSKARERLIANGVVPADRATDATLAKLPFCDGSFDLVFTTCVLIHVPPTQLETAYHEIHRVSKEWILTMEYFSQNPRTINYRGHDDLLFMRDFGGMWLDLYPDLEPVAQGFLWKRTTGIDDVTWWLFRK